MEGTPTIWSILADIDAHIEWVIDESDYPTGVAQGIVTELESLRDDVEDRIKQIEGEE